MKIRFQFVSNCSSSSFIVSKNSFKTSLDLAKEMLRIRNKEWKSKDIIKLDKLHNYSSNISFPTTNYNTFIVVSNSTKNYLVETCNNQDNDWSSIPKLDSFGEDPPDFFNFLIKTQLYWFIKYNLEGYRLLYKDETFLKKLPYYKNRVFETAICDKCLGDCIGIKMNNSFIKICPTCLKNKGINLDKYRLWKQKKLMNKIINVNL